MDERKLSAELIIANKELAFQNEEKEKRAAELIIANKELAFQNEEKEKRAVELIKRDELLLNQKNTLANIIEGTNAGTWDWNVKTGALVLNERWADIMGYTLKELRPIDINTWINNIHPDDLPMANTFIDKHFKGALDYFDVDFRQPHKNGGWVWVNSRGKVVEWTNEGKPLQMSGTHIDITENKKTLYDLVISKEKAEESDRLKSAFLANMSHEIRTPMNGILGFSDLLRTPNLSGEKQQKYIKIIEKSGKRMLNIIDDIVDISKIEAGLMNVDIKKSNVNEQIEYIYTFFKPEVEAKGMQLFFKNTLPAKEATIYTDREKLFSILTNLIKNAIKYTIEGSIEFGYVLKMGSEFIDQSRNAELEFFVKDTGIGIPKDRREAVFERFIQADIMDTMARQGAGLGLSISKAYVEMLGGKIWVESEEGIGSTFYFTLPYNAALKEKKIEIAPEVPDNTKNRIKNLKILITEDDEASEMILSINVSEFSNEIIKARTGTEAVEICRNNPDTDLILMDIQMPVMNGYEATRQIRQFNKDVIIIAQTAFGLSGDREKTIEAGCNDYIAKPINRDELLALIQKHFKK
jgi:hypothetical protein